MTQMFSVGSDEQQDNWDELLPHVEPAYTNSIHASTGLAPNEVNKGRLPRLPLSVLHSPNIDGHQSPDRDHLAYCNLATERQQRAYGLAREHHAVTASRMSRRNYRIMDALRLSPPYPVDGWARVYNSAATIRLGAKNDTDTTVLNTKLSSTGLDRSRFSQWAKRRPPTFPTTDPS